MHFFITIVYIAIIISTLKKLLKLKKKTRLRRVKLLLLSHFSRVHRLCATPSSYSPNIRGQDPFTSTYFAMFFIMQWAE